MADGALVLPPPKVSPSASLPAASNSSQGRDGSPNPFLSVALSIDAAVLRRAMAALRKVWTSRPSALSCGSTTIVHHPQLLSTDRAPMTPHPAAGRIWTLLSIQWP